ncbi:hypothetical protein [Streptomyces spongiae]|uniref:SH3 domain-containing protein n=1 Tax=Streptomyces spongiae TaxID=565072 RepID=A0A5N8XS95_9ACTN|nr:hypothetical protein [Streptomyces spongiae]MPY62239.1 hypothetical protein [Streptomyces spongiae]
MRLRTVLGAVVAVTALTAAPASAAGEATGEASGGASARASFTVWATDVNVRDNPSDPATCDGFPSPANCPAVAGNLQPNQPFEAVCQKQGEPVGGNPWWVYITRGDSRGYIASHYVDTPDDQLPGVPVCGA